MGKLSDQRMKKYILPVLFIALLIFPADASAGSKTKSQVLSYLTSLPSQSNKKVLSGQRTGWLNDGSNGHDMYGNDIFGDIYTKSGGKYPAIMGADIDYYGGGTTYNLSRLIDHWNNGGLVELTWHAANPANNNVWTWPLNTPTVTLPDVYTPGNSTYNNFRSHMVLVGDALQTLRDKGIVVLFRPLHEANAGNPLVNPSPAVFWWGGKDYNQYKTLWRYVYDYFTNTRGLNNIIWVYAVCPWWGHEIDYYPGSEYVDIVGYDYYPFGWDGNYDRFPWVPEYDTLRALGKPFALTELGQCPGDGSWDSCGGKDANNIINDIKSNMPDVVYWMNWDDQWELGRQSNLSQLFADSWVVNRADNPSGTTDAPAPALDISSGTLLPSGQQNVLYVFTLSATGGTSPYTWSLLSGNLPEGMSLSSSGVLSGTPTAKAVGTSSFTIQVATSGNTATKTFSVVMAPAASIQSKKPSSPVVLSIQ